jgi:hypothetical protein
MPIVTKTINYTEFTLSDFENHTEGRRFKDVVNNPDIDWKKCIQWLNDSERQERMLLAERHFDMPAIAGILKELESETMIRDYFDARDTKTTQRLRQAFGLLVKMHMIARGWKTTGKKGALGRRLTNRTSNIGGGYNTPRSFSRYVVSAERYTEE